MKVTSNGIRIDVTQQGSGSTALVFLHFWGGSSRTWAPVIAGLADDYRCIALDARGQGASDAPDDGYGAADLADDVAGVLAALRVDDYILVGHSMGGKTAQALASRRPPGLRGVVLVASSPPSPMAIGDEQRAQMSQAYATRASVEWSLDNVLTGSPMSAAAREQTIADALRISPAATRGWIETGTREDFSADVSRIAVPVTIVAGALDRVDPIDVVREHIVPHFPGARLHVLEGKGHLLPLEAPGEVAGIVRAFAAPFLARASSFRA